MEAPMVLIERRRWVLPTVIVAIIVVLAAAGVVVAKKKSSGDGSKAAAAGKKDDEKDGKKKAPVPVTVVSVAVAPISSYISSTANLVAENEVKVVAEAEGRVAQLMVEEGQYVSRGQQLATLVRDDAEIALTKARVRAQNARVSYERAREMASKQLISRGDFEKTEMEKDVAVQELAEAQHRIGKTVIRSPFSGRVTERAIREGQNVRPAETLFTVTDYDPLIARIYLPEKDVLALQVGREVRITLKASDQVTFAGRVRQISPVVDTATGTVKVTVEAVRPPDAVRPGAFVNIDIVRETHPGAVVIPREALIREMQKAHVFIAEGKVAKKRMIEVGLEEGDFVEALSGVKPGEPVIVAGQGGLKDGSPIKILPAAKS